MKKLILILSIIAVVYSAKAQNNGYVSKVAYYIILQGDTIKFDGSQTDDQILKRVNGVWTNAAFGQFEHNDLSGLDGGESGYYGHLTNIEKLRVSNWADSVQANMHLGDPGEVGYMNGTGTANVFSSNFKYSSSLSRLELAQLDFDYLYNNAGDLVASLPSSSLPTLIIENTLNFTGRASSVTSTGNMFLNSTLNRWQGDTGAGVKTFLMEGDVLAADVPITDAGGFYAGIEVETALQEVGDSIAVLRTDIVQSNWDESDSGDNSFILNKPIVYWSQYLTSNYIIPSAYDVMINNTQPYLYFNDSDGEDYGVFADNSYFYIRNITNGVIALQVAPNYQISLNSYGSGTYTGTETYNLSVDASGNVIETEVGGSGSSAGDAGAVQLSDGSGGFDGDAQELYWSTTNERLGINGDQPQYDLHVFGDMGAAGIVYDSNGDAGLNGEVFNSTVTGTDWDSITQPQIVGLEDTLGTKADTADFEYVEFEYVELSSVGLEARIVESGDITVLSTDYTIIYNGLSAVDVLMPASPTAGKIYILVNRSPSNDISLRNSDDTADVNYFNISGTTTDISSQTSVHLQYVGTAWYQIN